MSRGQRSDRMARVAGLAHNDEQVAARELADAQHLVHERTVQLQELERYRDEYVQQFKTNAGGGGNSLETLRNSRQFLQQLTQVIQQQVERTRQAKLVYEQRRSEWLAEHARASSLDKVAQRQRHLETQARERAERLEQDERAQRQVMVWRDGR